MTEKDLHEATDSEMSDQVVPEEEDQSIESEPDQLLAEEPQTSEDRPEQEPEESEEASEFLLKWQERHEAYLAEKFEQEADTEELDQAEEEDSHKKTSLFKKKSRPKIDPLPIESEDLKAELDQEKKKPAIPTELVWKTVPIISLALSLALICLYFISPLGKLKQLIITGNEHVESSKIVQET